MTGTACQGCPPLDVSWWARGAKKWQQQRMGLEHIDVTRTKDASDLLNFDFDITIIKAKADLVRKCPRCRSYFSQAFHIPGLWWTPYCKGSNGYFGCEDTTDEHGNMTGFNTWTRFLIKNLKDDKVNYEWYKLNVFTRWLSSSKQTIFLTFDTPLPISERMPGPLFDELDTKRFGDPFWVYDLLVEEIVRLQDQAVWAIRDVVRGIEEGRLPATRPNPDYHRLHDVSRHAIHISETLSVASKTMDNILTQHTDFMAGTLNTDKKADYPSKHVHQRLLFHEHVLSSLQYRSASNKERLLNEIQLAFNTVAQYDSGISVQIGRAAQVDSAAMKTIAFITLTFFPATFVCAIFSMSFFNFDPDSGSWSISDKFWVFWVVSIPITILTAVLWHYWGKVFPPELIGEEKVNEGAAEAKTSLVNISSELQRNITDGDIESIPMAQRRRGV